MSNDPNPANLFDAYYFAHGCGAAYQRDETWLSLFSNFADRIVQDFQPRTVLDAGCAMGFLVECLRERSVEAWGVDISEYAIQNVHESIREYCWVASIADELPAVYDLIVCIEVLEHLLPHDAERAIANLCRHTQDVLFSSTPFDYKEATHFNVQAPEYWAELFARQGFYRDVDYDASQITPWAVRYCRQPAPVHRLVRDYERRFWALAKENSDLRQVNLETRSELAQAEASLQELQALQARQAVEPIDAPLQTIAAYSPYLWPHAVAALRYVRPIQQAGLTLLPGKEGDQIYPQRATGADIVLIQREFPLYWEQYNQIMQLARAQGIPVVYELDDLLLELPDAHPDRAIDFYTPAILPIQLALTSADLVTTTTASLRDYLLQFNPNVCVLPNYLDDRCWRMQAPPISQSTAPVCIGFMGSDTHLPDLEMLSQVFLDLAARYQDRVLFRFWGCQPPAAIRQLPQVEWLPEQIFDYPRFAEYFTGQHSDILIAPLLDSRFNRCKSQVKLLEYSTLGAAVVCSQLEPYQEVITHGENGWLASTSEEWLTCLVKLVDDPEVRQRSARNLQATVQENWMLTQHAGRWIRAFQEAQAVARRGDVHQRWERIRQLQNMAYQTLMLHRKQSWEVQQRQADIHSLQEQLGQAVQEKDQALQANQQALSALLPLQAAQVELDEIHRSTAWSAVQRLWRLRLALFPKGSTREKLLPRSKLPPRPD